ncbi:hypothetical protein ES332_D06G082200v1 [Gossypium tomentosum]|uniref:Uncharacterized protein n=1 Tax=Gossypium tomentosum TaxID=34277 RepID=A0A5D2KG28_GOSTO|nr:hypothetical protein ES332_D06G082200v1 [Gossypium tomentosum]
MRESFPRAWVTARVRPIRHPIWKIKRPKALPSIFRRFKSQIPRPIRSEQSRRGFLRRDITGVRSNGRGGSRGFGAEALHACRRNMARRRPGSAATLEVLGFPAADFLYFGLRVFGLDFGLVIWV